MILLIRISMTSYYQKILMFNKKREVNMSVEKVDKIPEAQDNFRNYTKEQLIGKKVKFVYGLACSPKAVYEDMIISATPDRIKISGCQTEFDWDGNDVRFVNDKSKPRVSKIILIKEPPIRRIMNVSMTTVWQIIAFIKMIKTGKTGIMLFNECVVVDHKSYDDLVSKKNKTAKCDWISERFKTEGRNIICDEIGVWKDHEFTAIFKELEDSRRFFEKCKHNLRNGSWAYKYFSDVIDDTEAE